MKRLRSTLARFFQPAPSESRQHVFWNWFVRNSELLATYQTNNEQVLDAIQDRLHQVNESLAFEIGRSEDGVHEFIVSADGIREFFPEVIELVKAAPRIQGWRIIAFRPRTPDMRQWNLEYEGLSLSYSDFWYASTDEGEKLALTLFVRGMDESNSDPMHGAMYLMLDAALGEYDVETKIGTIELEPLTGGPDASGLKPIKELASEFDCRFPETAN